jgi:hypothetical protein
LVARLLLSPATQRAEHVFILEQSLAQKSFAVVRERFSNDNPEKEVLNTTQHFGIKRTVYDRQHFRGGQSVSTLGMIAIIGRNASLIAMGIFEMSG